MSEQAKYNTRDVAAFLQTKGLTDVQVSAFVGNFIYESGYTMDPEKHQGRGTAHGIAQWDDGRRDQLVKFAQDRGADPWTLPIQKDFIWHELGPDRSNGGGGKHNVLQELNGVNDINRAAFLVRRDYEQPDERYANDPKRQEAARWVYWRVLR